MASGLDKLKSLVNKPDTQLKGLDKLKSLAGTTTPKSPYTQQQIMAMAQPSYRSPTQEDINKLYQQRDALDVKYDPQTDQPLYKDYASQISAVDKKIADYAKQVPNAQLRSKTAALDPLAKGLSSTMLSFATTAVKDPFFSPVVSSTAKAIKDVTGVDVAEYALKPLKSDVAWAEKNIQGTKESSGKGYDVYATLAEGTAAALPQAALAIATGGTSAVTALPALGGNAGLGTAITSALSKMVQNPTFATSYAQSYGSSYNQAKASGASEDEAQLTATLVGLINSGIELTGGIETLPAALQTKNASAIKEWVTSALSEGKEEVVQGVIERLTEKVVYKPNAPLVSASNPDAVFNPKTAAQEFGGGTTIGGILSGGQVFTQKAIDSMPKPQNPVLNTNSNTPSTPIQKPVQAPQFKPATVGKPAQNISQNAPQSATQDDDIFPAYVFPDGKSVSFADPYGQHAEIFESLKKANKINQNATVMTAAEEGIIRFKPNSGLELSANVEPTRAQYDAIKKYLDNFDAKELYVDFTNGRSMKYEPWEQRTGKILSDIKSQYASMPEGMGAASAGMDVTGNKIQDLITDYGAIKPGEGPISTERIVELPKQTSEDKNVMQTMRTIMEAPVVTNGTAEVIEKMVVDEKFSREVNTDKGALQRAKDTIMDKGYQQSLKDFTAKMNKNVVTKDSVALGFTLLSASEAVGDSKTSVEIITDMVDNIRDAAQTLQAVRILKKMQPEYQLYAVQRSVNNFKNELQEKYGDRAPNLQIDDALAQAYLDALFAKDDLKAKGALNDLYRNIASQVPATFADKWDAWRYTAMLFNPVTHIKNIVGNYVFRGERFVKHVLSTTAQTVAKQAGAQFEPTRGFLTRKDSALIKEAQKYYNEDVEAILRYGKYDDATNKINEYRKIYGQGGKTLVGNAISKTIGKVAEGARKFNTEALSTEDNWVSKPAYVKSLASYLKANKVTFETAEKQMLDRARAFAILEAQKSSYRDSNSFSDFVANFRYRGKGRVGKTINALGEGILPFRRTPANILVRGLEYSPLGLAKSATVDVGKLIISKNFPDLAKKLHLGEMTVTEVMDNISEGLTGTALTGLGILLASWGLISVGTSGDEKEDKLDDTQGKQNFALTIGNSTYTIDWLAPAAMPLFIGVSVYDKLTDKSENGVTLDDALKVASDISDPLLETSMLQSLNDWLEGFGYAKQQDENLIWYGLSQAAMGYISQSIPSIGGRIARTIDPTRRTVFTDPQSGIPTDIQYFLKSQLNKIPGASSTNQPYVDQWGRTTETDLATRSVQNWFSPGYLKPINESPMETELKRLYEDYAKENEVNVLPPTTVRKYFSNNGEDVYMTAEEYTQYKKTSGQYAYKELTKLTLSSAYKQMTNEEKADAVSKVWMAAAEQAKTEVIEGRGEMRLPSAADGEKLSDYMEQGLSQKQAYALYKALDPLKTTDTETLKYQKVNTVLKQSLNQQQKVDVIASFFSSDTKESLLPYLSNPQQLITQYVSTKDSAYISMTIPASFSENKVAYELTTAEKNLFKQKYTEYFNSKITQLTSAELIKKLDTLAYEYAKMAVIRGRG
jgi:hypothetical protein